MKIVLYLLLMVFLMGCAKDRYFPVGNTVKIVKPTRKSIYKVEILDADFAVCAPGDPDLKPDLYLHYGYTDPIFNTPHYQVTPTCFNVAYDSLPFTITLPTPVDIDENSWQHVWRIYDQDGTSPNQSIDNFLGGYVYGGQFFGQTSYYLGGEYATIGSYGSDLLYSTQYKLVLKIYYQWRE